MICSALKALETIFEQTEVKIKSVDVIESQGEISIGREKSRTLQNRLRK
jgi:hypothetical protein